jgi:hypothetical protein
MKMFLGFAFVATFGGKREILCCFKIDKTHNFFPAIAVTVMDKDGRLKESKREREAREKNGSFTSLHGSSAALRCGWKLMLMQPYELSCMHAYEIYYDAWQY